LPVQKTNDKHDRNQNLPFSWGLLNIILEYIHPTDTVRTLYKAWCPLTALPQLDGFSR
jgi:hypothetical protein